MLNQGFAGNLTNSAYPPILARMMAHDGEEPSDAQETSAQLVLMHINSSIPVDLAIAHSCPETSCDSCAASSKDPLPAPVRQPSLGQCFIVERFVRSRTIG